MPGQNIPAGENIGDIPRWNGARYLPVPVDVITSPLANLNVGTSNEGDDVAVNIKSINRKALLRLDANSDNDGSNFIECYDKGVFIGSISCGFLDGELAIYTEPTSALPINFYPSGSLSLRLNIDGTIDVHQALSVEDTTPAQITANQDNYSVGTSGSVRLSTDASRNITGIAGGTNGRLLYIHNVGSFSIVVKHESASSTAANRFTNSGAVDLTITAGMSVLLKYDSTSQRWRRITS